MNGFLNIYKPSGMTSYDVIRKIKPALAGAKVGHLGTLDPLAQGVLPIAVGHATRLIQYISDHTKEYRAEMILGGVSDTQDISGVVERFLCQRLVAPLDIEATMKRFTGRISQIPPSYSAVHHQGKRLYELARAGQMVQAEPREIEIMRLVMLDYCQDGEVQRVMFEVECSAGTYVRTLCHDIGQALGCGAYMSSLVRTRSGPFVAEDTAALDEIKDRESLMRVLLPLDYPLKDLETVELDEGEIDRIGHGMTLIHDLAEEGRYYLLKDTNGALAAVAQGICQPSGDRALKPEKVFISA